MANAQVIQAADAAASAILAAWNASSSPPGASDGVERVYEVQVSDPEFLDALAGRQVWVFPGEYGRDAFDRAADDYAPHLTALIAERYTDAGPVPKAWLDVRTAFV